MLCLVIDRAAAGDDVLEKVGAALGAGVDQVQVRDRELEGADLLAFTDAVRAAARAANRPVRVLVNRRIDVALAAGADGVHLGFDAPDPSTARELAGPEALLGVSCHSAEEVERAAAGLGTGPAYAHLAPVFAPLSKPATRQPLGTEELAAASRHLPVLAQGGIDAKNAGACLAAGAAGVAVTGAILLAPDPAAATRALRRALDTGARP